MRKSFVLVSMDSSFLEKYINSIHNINMINSDKTLPITIESIYEEDEEDGDDVVINYDNKTKNEDW